MISISINIIIIITLTCIPTSILKNDFSFFTFIIIPLCNVSVSIFTNDFTITMLFIILPLSNILILILIILHLTMTIHLIIIPLSFIFITIIIYLFPIAFSFAIFKLSYVCIILTNNTTSSYQIPLSILFIFFEFPLVILWILTFITPTPSTYICQPHSSIHLVITLHYNNNHIHLLSYNTPITHHISSHHIILMLHNYQ